MVSNKEIQALRAAIATLYTTFFQYGLRPHIEGCPHCVSDDDQRRLRSKPLRELTVNDLDYYSFKAMTTWGTEHDFKYFLPRLFELLAFEWQAFTMPEALVGKLQYAGWRDWRKSEQQAIEDYFMSLWRVILTSFPYSPNAGECLCSMGQALDNLEPFLDVWRRSDSTAALRHLADYVCENGRLLYKKGKLSNAFWEGREEQMQQVVRWLADPLTVQMLERGFFQYASEPFADELAEAVDKLSWLQKVRNL